MEASWDVAVKDEEEEVCKILKIGEVVWVVPIWLVKGTGFEGVWEVTVRACCSAPLDATESFDKGRLVHGDRCLGGCLVPGSGVG